MDRKRELSQVKRLIKQYYDAGCHGLYDCRNLVGDVMESLFMGEYFRLDICYQYCYFEVFGATAQEFEELEKFYNGLGE